MHPDPNTQAADHDLDQRPDKPEEACGVYAVLAPGQPVANLTYFGLYALQHRGQESAGIAVSDGTHIVVYKDMGLVSQVFNEASLESLQGHIAMGHTRYSTTGASHWRNAQPTLGKTAYGTIALAHNGNLTNTSELLELLEQRYPNHESELRGGNTTDTAVLTALMAGDLDHTLEANALELLPKVKGAFCLVFMDETTLYAARDPQGVRPLVLGRLERGWVIASETAALDIVGASFGREVEPGELVLVDFSGEIRSVRPFGSPPPRPCIFEHVYFSRPDSVFAGRSVYQARKAIGEQLAIEAPCEADLVVPVPDSGVPAALGFAQACLDEALTWSRQRQTFGAALIERQAVRHKLMDMQMRISSTQAWVDAVTQQADAGQTGAEWVAQVCLLKNHATQTMQFCADAAVQLLGGMGYMRGTVSERVYREVKVMMIDGGSKEILKDFAERQFEI